MITFQSFREKIRDVKLRDYISIFKFLVALPISFIYKIKLKKFPLWLICEEENEARDNGYWFFKYVCEMHPEQNVTYAINKKSVDYKKVFQLGKVVQYGSIQHWILYLSAELNISSQKGGKPNAAVCYFLEISGILKNKRIFLQHGIIINDCKWLYYPVTKFTLFICSGNFEYQFVKKKFQYPNERIKLLGLSRYDSLFSYIGKAYTPRQILVMPTWRNWLNLKSKAEKHTIQKFIETDYYDKWQNFLNNPYLHDMLEKYNAKLLFYPHRNMQKYIDFFSVKDKRIEIANWEMYDIQTVLKESSLMITDYSSVFLDFVYMKKPVIFYQFDLEEFRKKQYEEGYFDYANNYFGKSFQYEQDLIDRIQYYCENSFAVDDNFLDYHDKFFAFFDNCNSERIYNELLKYRS